MKKLITLIVFVFITLQIQAQGSLIAISIYSMTTSEWNETEEEWQEVASKDIESIKAFINTETEVVSFTNDGDTKVYIISSLGHFEEPDGSGNATDLYKFKGIDDDSYDVTLWIRQWIDSDQYQIYIWYNTFSIRYDGFLI